MNKVRNFLFVLVGIILALAIAITIIVNIPKKPQMSIDFIANTVSGNEIFLHENIGITPTVLVFFDTELEESLEHTERIINNSKGAQVVAVSVNSIDADKQYEKLSDTVKTLDKLCFEGKDAVEKYNVTSAPVTYFIDIDGYVTDAFIGTVKEDTIQKAIQKITD